MMPHILLTSIGGLKMKYQVTFNDATYCLYLDKLNILRVLSVWPHKPEETRLDLDGYQTPLEPGM